MSKSNGTTAIVEAPSALLLSRRALAGALIPIRNIDPSKSNPRKRFDDAEMDELAASIKAHGVLQPVLVRPAFKLAKHAGAFWEGPKDESTIDGVSFEIVAGERRWRAAQLAGLERIPATIRELTDLEVREIQVIENEQRADLSPLEKAAGYKQLIADGYKLLDLPDKAKKAVEAGELPMSTAQLLARVPDRKAREELVKEALGNEWHKPSYRQLQETVKTRFMIELKRAPFNQKDAQLVPEAGSCEACPKRTGNNRAEYPEGRADVCTDPSCYRGKLEAHCARVGQKAKDEGLKVLIGSAAEKALSWNSDYVELAEKCYDDKQRRTYNKIVGTELDDKLVVAVDDDGRQHRLAPKKAVQALLKEKGIKEHASSGKYHDEQLKRQKEAKLKKAAGTLAVGEIVKKVEEENRDFTGTHMRDAWLPPLIDCVKHLIHFEQEKHFLRRRGYNGQFGYDDRGNAAKKKFKSIVEEATPRERLAILVELLVTRDLTEYGPYNSGSGRAKRICEAFGVNLPAIEKSVREAKKKPKEKATTKSTKGTKEEEDEPEPLAGSASDGHKALAANHRLTVQSTIHEVRLAGFLWGNLTRPIAALERGGIKTIEEAQALAARTGKNLKESLETIAGVGSPAAAAIAQGIVRATLSMRTEASA
jgi:ParB-like chromosome segregation protein Spo0J